MPDIFDDVAGRQGANAQVVAGPAGDIFDEVASRLEEPYRRAKPFETFRPGPKLTERAAPAAQPTLALPPPEKPETLDLTKYPANVFTGRYIDRPPIRTEEEKARLGVWPAPVAPPEQVSTGVGFEGVAPGSDILPQPVKRMLGSGAPSGSLAARLTGQQGTTGADIRLLAPEELMTPVERAKHPILTGVSEFAGGLTSPENILIMAMTQGLGALRATGQAARFAIPKTAPEVGALAARLVPRAISGYFAGTMGKQAAVDLPLAIREAHDRGDMAEVQRLGTQWALTALTAGLAGAHAVGPERVAPTAPVERAERPVEAPPRRAAAVPAQATPAAPEPLPAPIMPAEAPRVRPEPAVAEAPATTPAKDIFDVVVERPPQATSVPAKAEVLPAVVEPTPRPTPAPVGVPEKSVAKPLPGTQAFEDDFYRRAVAIATQEGGYLSTTKLQKELRVGYGLAARLIDRLRAEGHVNVAGERFKPTSPQPPAEPKPEITPAIELNFNFPMPTESATGLKRLSADPEIAQIAKNVGLSRVSVDEPYTFDLSQEGAVTKDGILRLNPNVSNAEHTFLHELGEIAWARASEGQKTLLKGLVEENFPLIERAAPGYARLFREGTHNEAVAELYSQFKTLPAGTRARLRELVPARPFEEVFGSKEEKPLGPPTQQIARAVRTRSWEDVREDGGYLSQQDDLAAMAKEHGDRTVVIKDVNGGRHAMPASLAARALQDPLVSGHVREVFLRAGEPGEVGPVRFDNRTLNALPGLRQGFERSLKELPESRQGVMAKLPAAEPAVATVEAQARGDIFDAVAAKPLEKFEATPYQRQQAQLYVNRIKNLYKREYAQSYLNARMKGQAEPERGSLSNMAAQAVRSELDSYLRREAPKKVAEQYSPDVIAEAEAEMRGAEALGSSLDRPGRYRGASDEAIEGGEIGPNARVEDKLWYGVTATKPTIAGQFPWFADPEISLSKVQRAVRMGKGAEYERIMGKIVDHIQAERESARPIIEEYGPQLRSLADQIRDVDPELARTMADLADGHARGFNNLRAYIEEKITDAESAAEFSKAIDDAAAEAGREAGIAEAAQPSPEAREGEGVLPGFAHALEEQRAAAGRYQGERLTEEINRPAESIEARAGEIERTSPLFRSTAASPQEEMFGAQPEREPTLAERRTQIDKRMAELEERDRVIAAGRPAPQGDIFDLVAAPEKPEAPGTLSANPVFDPAAWKAAFPAAGKAIRKFDDTTLSEGDLQKGIMREQTGELARKKAQLYAALDRQVKAWDKRNFNDQIDFILREQHGETQPNSTDQAIADQLQRMFTERKQRIENLEHGAFDAWREHYFPQMWERPNQVQNWVKSVLLGKRPIEGPKSFTKHRVFDDIQQGLDAGFKPLTTNPIKLALAKAHEMDRYIMAHETLSAMKEKELAKPVMVGEQPPAGWQKLDDRIGTIYGDPNIPLKEHFDYNVWTTLSKLAEDLGIPHERGVRIGGQRLGYAEKGTGRVVTKFATPESVLAHEIGHQLDWKYKLADQLVKRSPYREELRQLTDLFFEGIPREDVAGSVKREVRKQGEKMARMIEALVHAPEKFQQVAPNTWDFLHKFIADHQELKPLLEAKPSLRYADRADTVSAGGMVIRGYYYAPPEAAHVFNNYLSPGLQKYTTYNVVRQMGNTLNQAQLGLSAFHLGFTSLDSSVSDMALALERISRGEVGRAITPAMRSLTIVGSPINILLKGNKLLQEALRPGAFTEMSKLADAVAQGGGRFQMDPFYKNEAIDSFWRAWKMGEYGKAGLRAFPATLEFLAKPVMEYAVPRMKLGAMANLLEDAMQRAQRENWSPERRTHNFGKIVDSIDNRMGQMTYDNLFWNRAVKDLGMVSVRSLGWNLGTAREIFGGGVDVGRQMARLSVGERPELTHRMAYVMALPIVVGFTGAVIHYLSTGKRPETLTDYFFPQTGRFQPNGRPERLSLPSYLKDLYALNENPTRTVLNKVHPALTATAEFLSNKDYYGTEIRHADDPFIQRRLDDLKFIAKQFLPFAIRNAYQRAESVGEESPLGKRSLVGTAESMIGLVPAPRSLTQTPAERSAREHAMAGMSQGPRTKQQFEHSQTLRRYENSMRLGLMSPQDLRGEVAAHRLTGRDAENIARAVRTTPLERDFSHLPLTDALDVWDLANQEERKKLRPLLVRKRAQLENMLPQDRAGVQRRLREALYGPSRIPAGRSQSSKAPAGVGMPFPSLPLLQETRP